MNVKVISFTKAGQNLSIRLKEYLETDASMQVTLYSKCRFWQYGVQNDILPWEGDLQSFAGQAFARREPLIFLGACGIAVRSIAPFVKDKREDPPVLVMDEKGDYVIPLLSSHLGGGEELAAKIADALGAQVIHTTSSDVNHRFAVDIFAKENGLQISDMKKAKEVAAHIVNGDKCVLCLAKEHFTVEGDVPQELELCLQESFSVKEQADTSCFVHISHRKYPADWSALQLIPKNLIIGLGCRKGKSAQELLALIFYVLDQLTCLPEAVKCIASIDLKKEEQGLLEAAEVLNVPFLTFSAKELQQQSYAGESVEDFAKSPFVERVTGVSNVCERAAVAAGASLLLQRKISYQGMTIAVGIQKGRICFE